MKIDQKTIPTLALLFTLIAAYSVVTFNRNKDYRRKIDLGKATVRLNPRSVFGLNVCGSYYRAIGAIRHSFYYRKKAIKYDRRKIPVLLLEAMMLEDAGKPKEALTVYERCVKDGKYSRYAVGKQIWINMKIGNTNRSEELFRHFLSNEKVTRFPNYFIVGTDLFLLKEDRNSAEKYLRMAVARDPSTPLVWYEIGRRWEQLGNTQQALSAYEKSLRLAPDYHPAQKKLAPLYQKKGRLGRAMELYSKLVKADKADFKDCLNFGRCYSESNLFIMAADFYKRANRLQPDNYPAHYNLGALYVNHFKWYEEAAAEFRKALPHCDSNEKRALLIQYITKAEQMAKETS